jgi:hypothetical protein
MAVNNLGGGGCPAYDILVEDLPFDFLQPRMERQVTQAGYGGPFVVRGNPIGAIWDAIKGFCFPAPMQASSDGSQYTDLSGSGLDTYGGYTQTDLGNLGGGYFGVQYPANNQCQPPANGCGTGTWDYSQCMCVPVNTGGTTGGTPTTPTVDCSKGGCDPTCLEYVTQQASNACSNYDAATLTALAVRASGCATATSGDRTLSGNWASLASKCVKWAAYITGGKMCDGTPRPAMPAAGGGGGTPTPTGGTTTGGTPAGGNPSTGNAGGTTPTNGGPLGYINAAHPSGSSSEPGARIITSRRLSSMPPMPEVPNPQSLTEGNIYFQPHRRPMLGMFDFVGAESRTPVVRPKALRIPVTNPGVPSPMMNRGQRRR